MVGSTTCGVLVEVESFYQLDYSDPRRREFMYAYRVHILNQRRSAIKIISRHWDITDGDGIKREVEGEGIVGTQPVIGSGESYQYISGANLHNEIGTMEGYFTVETDEGLLTILIPKFTLLFPALAN